MYIKKPGNFLAALLCAGALAMQTTAAIAGPTKAFKSPEAAMDAFIAAIVDNDEASKVALLGADYRSAIPPIDDEARYRFVEAWARSHKIEMDSDTTARIAVGDKGWTLPIPLVKTSAGWRFDMKAGGVEMELRQIGRNELAAIQVARAYVDAQMEYAQKDRNGNGVLEYARVMASSPGKMDGLYWATRDGAEESPLGPHLARAAAKHGLKQPGSYYGYRYRILTAQGPDAPGGARDYIVDKKMTGGFGLLLWPNNYGHSGVMSFMVSQDGQVYEKNLGTNTATQAAGIKTFNPDASWRKVGDNP